MEQRSKTWFMRLLLFFSFFFFSSGANLSIVTDSISPGQSLSGIQTMVSKGSNFELGFFSPGNSHKHYIGIWFKMIPIRTVVWVANRDKPLANTTSAELKIYHDGNLVLINQSQIPIWSTNSSTPTTSNSTVAVLLDTGNLVLRDGFNSSHILWQSFDHPTDTVLPTQRFGLNRVAGENMVMTSWRNSEDPSPGLYSLARDTTGADQFVQLWNGSEVYWKSGLWNGLYFDALPQMTERSKFGFTYDQSKEGDYVTYFLDDKSIIARLVMNVSGQTNVYVWLNSSQSWLPINPWPKDQCEVYSFCGDFSVCNQRNAPICRCLPGFEPVNARDWDANDWRGGCVRKTSLQCDDNGLVIGERDKFLMLPNMQLPTHSLPLMVGSARECEVACSSNCSCSAYAYDRGCFVWNGNLLNILESSVGDGHERGSLFVRHAASEPSSSSSGKTSRSKDIALIVGVVAGALAVLSLVLVLTWICQRRRFARSSKLTEGHLVQFRYRDLQRATGNFSRKLGQGGFGSVFKGELPDSTAIAVKKLEGLKQGEKQFRTEVRTMGTIQHVNSVRLRGFCSKGDERLLVYDYMPKGSLDSHLFRDESEILDWETRYQIALGTARGLSYLHEKCRECIIHCDIKPENILLDEDFNPKVADFGMAKLIGRDFSRALTTMRGTIGYLAPEWISGSPVTPKVDVYSFGMVLFELISGRRNSEKGRDGKFFFFPLFAACKINDGEVLSLLDWKLDGSANIEELNRVCKAACWCIQDDESCRPAMGQVVQILEGVVEVSMPPIPRSLQNLLQNADDSDSG